jgi:hypothetical protein
MKRTPLLLTALGINVALVSVVGVSILKDTCDPTPPSPRVDAVTPTNSEPRRTLSKREPKRDQQVPSTRSASFAASPAVARTTAEVPVQDQTMNAETGFSANNESIEALQEPARVIAPTAQRAKAIPQWAVHPQVQVRLRSVPPRNGTAVVPLRDPAVENAPPSLLEPVEAAQATAAVPSDSGPQTNAANFGIEEIDPPHSSPWPRGSFTREEQLYRAQFGWQAFAAAVRERAVTSEHP